MSFRRRTQFMLKLVGVNAGDIENTCNNANAKETEGILQEDHNYFQRAIHARVENNGEVQETNGFDDISKEVTLNIEDQLTDVPLDSLESNIGLPKNDQTDKNIENPDNDLNTTTGNEDILMELDLPIINVLDDSLLNTSLLDISNMDFQIQEDVRVEPIEKANHSIDEFEPVELYGDVFNNDKDDHPEEQDNEKEREEQDNEDEREEQDNEEEREEQDNEEEREEQDDEEEREEQDDEEEGEEENNEEESNQESTSSDEEANLNRTGRPKKGRKRKVPHQTREIRKNRKNSNKKFVSQNGKTYYPKEFRDYHCTYRCHEKVTLEARKNMFQKFWSLGNYNAQNMFICAHITEVPVKRKRVQHSKRNFTRNYKMENETVCRTIFVQSLRISTKRVDTALKKMKGDAINDRRGVAGGKNKLDEHRKDEVRNHIKKIPSYKSHYCREKTESRWLPTDMTLTKMYSLYKEEVEVPVSQSEYNKIFYEEFNLRRKPLKKDTCNTCDAVNAKLQSTLDEEEIKLIKEQHESHLKLVEDSRTQFKKDMKNAQEYENKETLTFDLQKTLPLPRVPTNIVYYKRQIMLYNLGVHSAKSNKGFFNLWVEGTAGRGSQEVGSVLKKYIEENCQNVEDLVLWSDSCGGQNRNINIVLLLKKVLSDHPTLKNISLKFLIPGHTFLPNDSEFGDVECHLKTHQRVYTDDDYASIMKSCRRKNPFSVTKLGKEDFFSVARLVETVTNRKKDVVGQKINWFKFRQIEFKKSAPFSIFTRTEFDGPQQEIDIQKKRVGRPSMNAFGEDMPLLWPEGKDISPAKLKDLKSLMVFIPSDAKAFYRGFSSSSNVEDDIEGFNAELDFEVEFE